MRHCEKMLQKKMNEKSLKIKLFDNFDTVLLILSLYPDSNGICLNKPIINGLSFSYSIIGLPSLCSGLIISKLSKAKWISLQPPSLAFKKNIDQVVALKSGHKVNQMPPGPWAPTTYSAGCSSQI
jgi:hypothetical protein